LPRRSTTPGRGASALEALEADAPAVAEGDVVDHLGGEVESFGVDLVAHVIPPILDAVTRMDMLLLPLDQVHREVAVQIGDHRALR
jgi:hypothetical protein